MESLSDTDWDVLIAGTGLAQSLLALALSRSGKKVLHIDRNDIYGGPDAALSLQDAEKWEKSVNEALNDPLYPFSRATIRREETEDSLSSPSPKLGSSRSYSLTLSPQLIYTQSRLIPVLVSSQVYQTLEFQAVGNWWLAQDGGASTAESADKAPEVQMKRIPSGREDVFADDSINVRSKRALMKFLRHVVQRHEDEESSTAEEESSSFEHVLTNKFRLPDVLQQPLLGLALSPAPANETPSAFALDRINRHMRSIGVFGPGFGSLIVKWGGLSEVAQASCRALAVGGGIYVLGRRIESAKALDTLDEASTPSHRLSVSLDDGETIKTKFIAGAASDLPGGLLKVTETSLSVSARAIYIVSSPMEYLFTPSADSGPPPAGVMVVFPPEAASPNGPAYLIIHSSDTGECPNGQCVIYASTSVPKNTGSGLAASNSHDELDTAVNKLLSSSSLPEPPRILWSLHYDQRGISPLNSSASAEVLNQQILSSSHLPNILTFPPPSLDLAFDDTVIDQVIAAWKRIMEGDNGNEVVDEAEFMKFESRENVSDD